MKFAISLLLILNWRISIAQTEGDLLKDHYTKTISELLKKGRVADARKELSNAKRLAPDIYTELKTIEKKVVDAETQKKVLSEKREKARVEKEKEERSLAIQRDKEEREKSKQLALEREIEWKQSLPERRCACLDLARYYNHLLKEEKSRSFIDKVKAYNLESSMKSYEKAAILLGRQVGEKSCLSSTDLTEVMNMSRKYDLVQSLSQKCDLPMILN